MISCLEVVTMSNCYKNIEVLIVGFYTYYHAPLTNRSRIGTNPQITLWEAQRLAQSKSEQVLAAIIMSPMHTPRLRATITQTQHWST